MNKGGHANFRLGVKSNRFFARTKIRGCPLNPSLSSGPDHEVSPRTLKRSTEVKEYFR